MTDNDSNFYYTTIKHEWITLNHLKINPLLQFDESVCEYFSESIFFAFKKIKKNK